MKQGLVSQFQMEQWLSEIRDIRGRGKFSIDEMSRLEEIVQRTRLHLKLLKRQHLRLITSND